MIIPLGTDRPLARPTLVTHILVWINVLVFAAGLAVNQAARDPSAYNQLRDQFILDPTHLKIWSLITYAFLHANFMHIFGNMLFLWVLGPNVEDRFGRIGFAAFYLLGGAAAGGLHALLDPHPVLGASGAIAAVTGAYLVLFPRTQVKVLFLLVVIGIYQVPAWWFIGGQVAWDFIAQGMGRGGNVARLAHLGGYAFGIGVSLLLLATGLLKREMYDLFSISKHAARRRQFREASYRSQAAAKAATAVSPQAEGLAAARAEVSERLASSDFAGAAASYRALLQTYGSTVGSALLSRRTQYDLANDLFRQGDHQTAATAYQLFLEGYPKDPEIPVVRLMLGLIKARYLNDPVSAKQQIREAMPALPEGDHKALARELLTELG